jgi:hypothetical protein
VTSFSAISPFLVVDRVYSRVLQHPIERGSCFPAADFGDDILLDYRKPLTIQQRLEFRAHLLAVFGFLLGTQRVNVVCCVSRGLLRGQ